MSISSEQFFKNYFEQVGGTDDAITGGTTDATDGTNVDDKKTLTDKQKKYIMIGIGVIVVIGIIYGILLATGVIKKGKGKREREDERAAERRAAKQNETSSNETSSNETSSNETSSDGSFCGNCEEIAKLNDELSEANEKRKNNFLICSDIRKRTEEICGRKPDIIQAEINPLINANNDIDSRKYCSSCPSIN